MRIALLWIGMLSGAGALAAWVILGLPGDPWGGGLTLAAVALILTAFGVGAFLLERQLGKRR